MEFIATGILVAEKKHGSLALNSGATRLAMRLGFRPQDLFPAKHGNHGNTHRLDFFSSSFFPVQQNRDERDFTPGIPHGIDCRDG